MTDCDSTRRRSEVKRGEAQSIATIVLPSSLPNPEQSPRLSRSPTACRVWPPANCSCFGKRRCGLYADLRLLTRWTGHEWEMMFWRQSTLYRCICCCTYVETGVLLFLTRLEACMYARDMTLSWVISPLFCAARFGGGELLGGSCYYLLGQREEMKFFKRNTFSDVQR